MEVLGSSPAKADDRSLLGHCLLLLARPAEALPHLEAAVSARPDDAKLRGALGQALLELGRPADAIPHLEAVLEQSSDGAAYYRLARAYRLTGRLEEARTTLEAYRQLPSEDP
jgi:predicted Zn-dependent protease